MSLPSKTWCEVACERSVRIAELEAEVERCENDIAQVNAQLDRLGVAFPGTWPWERVKQLVEEVERLSRRPDLTPDQCALAADAADLADDVMGPLAREGAALRVIRAALCAAAEQEGR